MWLNNWMFAVLKLLEVIANCASNVGLEKGCPFATYHTTLRRSVLVWVRNVASTYKVASYYSQ